MKYRIPTYAQQSKSARRIRFLAVCFSVLSLAFVPVILLYPMRLNFRLHHWSLLVLDIVILAFNIVVGIYQVKGFLHWNAIVKLYKAGDPYPHLTQARRDDPAYDASCSRLEERIEQLQQAMEQKRTMNSITGEDDGREDGA